MAKHKVTVLGASGMLGSMVSTLLAEQEDMDVRLTVRNDAARAGLPRLLAGMNIHHLDAATADAGQIAEAVADSQYVINCIGITKPLIRDDNAAEIERAIRINALFPQVLAKATQAVILQIATDCVYTGVKGDYNEADPHDALDVYGKTKSLGESWYDNVKHLRCSIIGPEPSNHRFLLDWFLGQKPDAEVSGFTNHLWNGVTTCHFGKICMGIIRTGLALPRMTHVVPNGTLTKHDLLGAFADSYGRKDVRILPKEAGVVVNRTLTTRQPEVNKSLWQAAGYQTPPTVKQMVQELSQL